MLRFCVDSNKGIEINVSGDITDICVDLTYGIRKLYERIKETNPKDADFFAKQLKDVIPGLVLCENPVLEVLGLISEKCKERMQAQKSKDGDKSKDKAEDSKEEDEKDLTDFMSNFESLIGIICGKISDNEDDD